MTVIRNFGVAGLASTVEFGKQGGTLNYDNATKVFSFAQSSALTIPTGNNSQRPSGSLGMIRVNTEATPYLELYNGTAWTQVGGGGSNSGTVTTVSVVGANGFTGTVANPTTTPAISIRTTVSGILKGAGGSLVEASTATDYQVPLILTTTGTGLATFNGRTLNIPPAGVTQIVAGTNISISSTGSSGTGIVTINLAANSIANLSGGAANQIPYQTAPNTTAFSSKFTWNNVLNTLALGEFGGTGVLSGVNPVSSFPSGALLIKGGNAGTLSPAAALTLSGGEGFASTYRGGNVIIQGGGGSSAGSGDIVFRTSDSSNLVDRFRILANGAWSIGPSSIFTGEPGQVLTSLGPDEAPIWQNPSGGGGVTQLLAGQGITLDPEIGIGTVTISATGGGGGGGTPGGDNGQLQYNKSGEFSGTTEITYTENTLTVGKVNSTFTIATVPGSNSSAASLLIKTGDQYGYGGDNRLTLSGGHSFATDLDGGSIYLDAGYGSGEGTSVGGSVYIRTGDNEHTERLRINSTGAWGLNGENYGSTGQVLTSMGPNSPPLWMTVQGGGGTGSGVTLINVTGGTTGLTTIGGPVTSTGTIVFTGTLRVSNGGTGRTRMPGSTGSLFFNNENTFDAIGGMTYDGSGRLNMNNISISSDDVLTEFTPVSPLTIQPGTARNVNSFAGNATLAGGNILSSINRAGNAIVAGGVNTTASKSGYVILRTNNFDRLTINENGALGVPGAGAPNFGTPGQVLSSQGPNSPPVWRTGSGTGSGGIIAITVESPLFTTGGDTPNITLGTVPTTAGGTGYSNYTAGDILWARDATTLETLNIGAPGQVLTVLNNRPQWSSSLAGVQSFSGGATGLTPATYTTGLITLGGRLNIAFGGTGGNNKSSAFNNLAPTQFNGDMIYYDINGGNKRLPLGASGTVLTAGSTFPEWKFLGGLDGALPVQQGNYGRFLTTTETSANSGAVWADFITFTGNYYEGDNGGNSINIRATNGGAGLYPSGAGGSVNIISGDARGPYPYSGANINLVLGYAARDEVKDPFSQASFNIFSKPSTLLFTINRNGAIGLGGNTTGSYGDSNYVLTSRGPGTTPIWTDTAVPSVTGNSGKYLTNDGTKSIWASDIVNKIVAGNSNIVVTPVTGTGIVTLSVVGEGFQGVTSFSGGNTGLTPAVATTGPVLLTGTLLTTSGGTGFSQYSVGDILYASAPGTLTKLPIGANGRTLVSNGTVPYWAAFTGLPDQTGSSGRFLTTNGSVASWSNKLAESGLSLNIVAENGSSGGPGSPGGNITIQAGSAGSSTAGGGGIITLQTGSDSGSGYLTVRSPSIEFFRITRFGSWSLGPSGTNTGNFGQILTSTGPNSSPTWTNAGAGLPDQSPAVAGYYLTTDGSTASWVVVPGGTGAPGGGTGQLQYNNNGAFAGTTQIVLSSLNTLRLGAGNTFNILGADSLDDNLQPGAGLLLRAGSSGATSIHGATASAGSITIQGGSGKISGSLGSGGNVLIVGGTCSTSTTVTPGYVSIGTGAATTERIRFEANGAWSVGGQAGLLNQSLVSGGPTSTPRWKTLVNSIIAGSNISITSSVAGGVGDVTINANIPTPAIATTSTLGVIRVGSGLSITSSGTLNVVGGGGGGGDVLSVTGTNGVIANPTTGSVVVSGVTATTNTIGVVRVGSGLVITNNGTLSVAPQPPEQFELAFAATGLAGNGTIFIYTASRQFIIPQNMTGSYAVALNPASGDVPLQIFHLIASSGVINNIGAINFPAGQFAGVITFGTEITFNPGDTLFMRINVVPDATLGNLSVTIAATLTT